MTGKRRAVNNTDSSVRFTAAMATLFVFFQNKKKEEEKKHQVLRVGERSASFAK